MSVFDRFKAQPAAAGSPATAPVTIAQFTSAPGASAVAPGVDLAKRAPGLIDLHKKAGISLAKNNLIGVKAAVYLVLDYSGSMARYYRDGTVQAFTEQVLAAAVHFDDDGSIPVILFDAKARPAEDVTIDDYQGAVARMQKRAGRMSTTNYAGAMQAVIGHYQASGATAPALVIFETDGSPDSRRDAEAVLCHASTLPIFWQFVGFGDDSFQFLRKLDDLAVPQKRAIDNAGFFAAGRNPAAADPGTLYDNLMGEFPDWLAQARHQGIVRN
ncbi:VWA domain-containing protein [Pedococcus sp. KACC 23699]|uniref:VWA domain-containing protein n=1 Tax=Pedococcus sp. KACC 23699 TaxID=3149228 RepID=A0AAU7JX57_9MICO